MPRKIKYLSRSYVGTSDRSGERARWKETKRRKLPGKGRAVIPTSQWSSREILAVLRCRCTHNLAAYITNRGVHATKRRFFQKPFALRCSDTGFRNLDIPFDCIHIGPLGATVIRCRRCSLIPGFQIASNQPQFSPLTFTETLSNSSQPLSTTGLARPTVPRLR